MNPERPAQNRKTINPIERVSKTLKMLPILLTLAGAVEAKSAFAEEVHGGSTITTVDGDTTKMFVETRDKMSSLRTELKKATERINEQLGKERREAETAGPEVLVAYDTQEDLYRILTAAEKEFKTLEAAGQTDANADFRKLKESVTAINKQWVDSMNRYSDLLAATEKTPKK